MDDESNKGLPTPGAAGRQAPEPPATPSLGQEHEPQGSGGKRSPTGTPTGTADDRAGQTREPGYDEA